MPNLDWIYFIFLQLAMAELAIQMVVSELSQWLKGLVWVNQPYNQKLVLMSSKKFWQKLLNYGWFFALPLMLVFKAHKFMSDLLGCPWCCNFWMATAANHFYLGLPLIDSFMLAPVSLVFVTILDKLHSS